MSAKARAYGLYGPLYECAHCGRLIEPDGPSSWWCIDKNGVHDARAGALTP